MRYRILTAFAIAAIAPATFAQTATMGAATQTIRNCEFLPIHHANYTYTYDTTSTIQISLAKLGYYNGPINGVYDGPSIAAVKKFQADHGLVVDGAVGPVTGRWMGFNFNPHNRHCNGPANIGPDGLRHYR